MEVLLAILLPGPNMAAPVRFLFGYPPGNRISLCVGRCVRCLAFGVKISAAARAATSMGKNSRTLWPSLGRTLKRAQSEGVMRILPPAAALPAYPDGGGFVAPCGASRGLIALGGQGSIGVSSGMRRVVKRLASETVKVASIAPQPTQLPASALCPSPSSPKRSRSLLQDRSGCMRSSWTASAWQRASTIAVRNS